MFLVCWLLCLLVSNICCSNGKVQVADEHKLKDETKEGTSKVEVKRMNKVPLTWKQFNQEADLQNSMAIRIFFTKMKPKMTKTLQKFGIFY